MRDSQRIKEILPLLQSVWEKSPNLRLGQLIFILASLIGKDPFYMEEDDLLLAIQKFHEQRLIYKVPLWCYMHSDEHKYRGSCLGISYGNVEREEESFDNLADEPVVVMKNGINS